MSKLALQATDYSASEEGVVTTYYAQLKNAGDLGRKLSGYPEYFININAGSAVSIMENMIGQQCGAKGFDGVETDLDETFDNNEGRTGFTITESDEVSYLQTLANYMHSLGLAWFAKNTDDIGSPSFSNYVEPFADAVITEQCNEYGTCSDLGNFIGTRQSSTLSTPAEAIANAQQSRRPILTSVRTTTPMASTACFSTST